MKEYKIYKSKMKNNINNNEAHQGNEYVNNHQTIKIDLPTSLIKQLEEVFREANSMTFKKILFIISLINKGKWNSYTKRPESYCELSVKHLKTYLALNSKLSPIIKTLLDSNIIEKVGGYVTKVSYQKYRLTTPLNIENKNEEYTTLFLTSEDGAYVNKYITDGYIVKYNSTTKVKKEVVTKEEKSEIEELKKAMADMKKQIEELKKENEILRQSKNKEDLSTATIEEYIQDDRDLIEEEIEIIKESGPNVIEDNLTTFQSNDIYATEIIDLMKKGIKEFDDIFVAVYSKYFQALDDENMKLEVIEMLSNKIEEFIGD